MSQATICDHLKGIESVKRERSYQCDECVKTGSTWVHLRTCQTCGATHCCDSSPNRHATRHAQVTGHPVVASAEPGERWLYCYPDRLTVRY
ncbi:MAG TPA: UBP-type zinc finger domain-containing protein [Gammaproteobacteria bacterium]